MNFELVAIMAVASNNVIGDSSTNFMPWKLKPDLVRFKSLTEGYPVIGGRVTLANLKLPNRYKIVLSTAKAPAEGDYDAWFSGKQTVINHAKSLGTGRAFLVGGALTYKSMMDNVTRAFVTRIEQPFPGDVYFNSGCFDDYFAIVNRSRTLTDPESGLRYTYYEYARALPRPAINCE